MDGNATNEHERYYDGMLRMMKEADMTEGKQNALQNAKRMIWVTFKKEGIHKYPAALDDPSLATGDEAVQRHGPHDREARVEQGECCSDLLGRKEAKVKPLSWNRSNWP